MSFRAIKYIKDSSIAVVFLAFALVAELITVLIVSIMSLLFHGGIGNDFLITGAIAAFVATLGTTQVTYYLLKELREGDRITEMLEFNRKILNTSSIGIFTYDAPGQCIFANEAAAVIFGTKVADLLSQNFHQLRSWKESELYELALRTLNTDSEQQAEAYVVTTSGRGVWLSLSFSSFHAKGEKHLLVFCHDISERIHAEKEFISVNRVLNTLSECNQLMVRATDEETLLRELCRIITEFGGYRTVMVGYTEQDEGKTVRVVAQAGYEEGFRERVRLTWDDTELGHGPVGTAIRNRASSVFQNIKSDKYSEAWREAAIKRGYGSAIGLPLIAGSEVLGALAIYAPGPSAFDEKEVNLLEELADDMTYGIMVIRARGERDQTEKTLRESEERYKRLLESVTNYIYTVHIENGRPSSTIHGPACVSVTGYTTEEYNADPYLWYRMIHEEDRKAILDHASRILSNGPGASIEHRILHKDGSIRWVRDTMVPKYDEQGRLVAYDGLVADITDLKESEERFRAIFDSASDGLLLADADTKRFYLGNGMIHRMLGYGADELIQLTVDEIHPKADLPYVLEQFEKQVRGELTVAKELPVRRKDGSVFHADISTFPLTLQGKHCICGNFRDVTERREAEQRIGEYSAHLEQMVEQRTREAMDAKWQADAANRAKSDFLANMSHELRTPLNSIQGFSEVLQDELYGKLSDKQKAYINYINTSGNHLLSLINDILDLSKVESGKLELDVSRVQLGNVLRGAMSMLKEKAMKHGIKTVVDIELGADIEIDTDERKLKQILFNLLSNAVKFTPEGGSVSVRARLTRDEGRETRDEKASVEISVSDTGIGIKSEDTGKLFKPFSQIEPAYTKTYEGTGLGLALTRRLVEFLGGRIWVESEFGKGSTFAFVLPLQYTIGK